MFLTKLSVTFDDDGEGATLNEVLVYRDGGHLIMVPHGFHTNFGSVPGNWILPALVPKIFRYASPFVLHDWLYSTCGEFGLYTRKECDGLLKSAMHAVKNRLVRPVLAYAGVRAGGWIPWRKYCKENGYV